MEIEKRQRFTLMLFCLEYEYDDVLSHTSSIEAASDWCSPSKTRDPKTGLLVILKKKKKAHVRWWVISESGAIFS